MRYRQKILTDAQRQEAVAKALRQVYGRGFSQVQSREKV